MNKLISGLLLFCGCVVLVIMLLLIIRYFVYKCLQRKNCQQLKAEEFSSDVTKEISPLPADENIGYFAEQEIENNNVVMNERNVQMSKSFISDFDVPRSEVHQKEHQRLFSCVEKAVLLITLQYNTATGFIDGNISMIEGLAFYLKDSPDEISFQIKLIPNTKFTTKTKPKSIACKLLNQSFKVGPVPKTFVETNMLCIKLYGRRTNSKIITHSCCFGECSAKLNRLCKKKDPVEFKLKITPYSHHTTVENVRITLKKSLSLFATPFRDLSTEDIKKPLTPNSCLDKSTNKRLNYDSISSTSIGKIKCDSKTVEKRLDQSKSYQMDFSMSI